jgi:DNA-binding transcriptional ArsR family regulator
MSDELDDIIKALAHPVRRDILRWLKEPERYFPEQEPAGSGADLGRAAAGSPNPRCRPTSPPCNAPA